VHTITGQPLDPSTHAYETQVKKRTCMRKGYWERGGRERRLTRYVRKRRRNQSPQLTLDVFTVTCDMSLYTPRP